MEYAVSVHVFNGLDELEHIVFDPLLWQVIWSSFDSLVHILLHKFKDEGKSPGWLIVHNLNKLNDVWVRVETLQGFNFPKIVYLFNTVEVTLHALDGDILAISERLCLEYLRKGAFAQLADKSVLVHIYNKLEYFIFYN